MTLLELTAVFSTKKAFSMTSARPDGTEWLTSEPIWQPFSPSPALVDPSGLPTLRIASQGWEGFYLDFPVASVEQDGHKVILTGPKGTATLLTYN